MTITWENNRQTLKSWILSNRSPPYPQIWIPCVPLPSTRSSRKWMLAHPYKKVEIEARRRRRWDLGEELASRLMNVAHWSVHQIVKPTNIPLIKLSHFLSNSGIVDHLKIWRISYYFWKKGQSQDNQLVLFWRRIPGWKLKKRFSKWMLFSQMLPNFQLEK